MTVWTKVGAIAIVAVALFLCGYKFAAAMYKADIAEMVAEYEAKVSLANQKTSEDLVTERRKNAQAIDAYLERISQLESRSRSDAVLVDRLQRQLASRAEMSATGADSCRDCQEQIARCQRLLIRGVGLAPRGAEMAVRNAAEKDAVVEIHSGK